MKRFIEKITLKIESYIWRGVGVCGICFGYYIPTKVIFAMKSEVTGKTEWEITTILVVYLISGVLVITPQAVMGILGKVPVVKKRYKNE